MNFLQRLFSQPKFETLPPTPQPAIPKPDPEPVEEPKTSDGLNRLSPGLHIGKLSDVGRQRERNEDSFCVIESLVHYDLGVELFGLFVVADGMGGHQKGEIASSLAARTAANSILEDVDLPYLTSNPNANNRPLNEALVAAVESANIAVQEQVPDGGTTLTTALIMGNNAYIAHVGDTRAYLIKEGVVKCITQDHSLAKRLEDLGQATPEEAAQVQNVLYRAIGQNSAVEVDTYMQHLPAGSSLMLCSDGLWGQIKDEDIAQVFASASAPQEACQQLIDIANENGGPDNITAIIVSMGVENQAP